MARYKASIYYEGSIEIELDADDGCEAINLAISQFGDLSPTDIQANVVNVEADVTEMEEDEEDG